jgi:predicted acylesterase/phospholipase RssA
LYAQNPSHPRPHIALVLEDGSALGFAHIGVIRYLEEHRIPVDMVVGTSMGGLAGGFYATGRSAAEIEQLTDEIDWDQVLSGLTAFQDLSFRRKEDRVAFPNRLEFGFKHKKFSVPSGLNAGHQTGLVIDRTVLAYSDLLDFDSFPIAFRCVATDISLGREKIFDHGSVSDALRATMAIPGVFAPVVVDGHVYTDGGAVDNLPVDVAKRAGADIVIAVYLDAGPLDPAAYNSLLSVAARNISIMVSANELRNMAAADVLVSVDVHGFASFDFELSKQIIPKGYEAAQKKQQMLATLSLNEGDWSRYLAQRNTRVRTNFPVPRFIEVQSANAYYSESLKESLSHFAGRPIDPAALERSLTRLTGTGVMSSVGYSLTQKQGQSGLEVTTYEKNYGPPLLNLGISIDGSDPDNVLFGMAGRLTFLNLGGYRAEWRSDAFFGSTYGARSECYRPFSHASKWFVAPHIYAISAAFNDYSGNDRLAEYRLERDGIGADVGYELSPRSELRLGEGLLWFKTIKKISNDPFPNT